MQNSKMIEGLMDNLSQNPEMLKSMFKMMPPNPLSGYIEKASPSSLKKIIKVLKVLFKGYLITNKTYKFIMNHKMVCGVIVASLVYYKWFS